MQPEYECAYAASLKGTFAYVEYIVVFPFPGSSKISGYELADRDLPAGKCREDA